MTSVYSARDSISTRPKISAKRMPAWAPGLRAEASQAEAASFPWPRPQRPDARPMARYAAGRCQSPLPPPEAGVCAKIGLASAIARPAAYINLRFIQLLLVRNCSPVGGSASILGDEGLTLAN